MEALGVIKREFRTIDVSGIKYNNVLFIDFFPKRLYELTYPDAVDESPGLEPELWQHDPVPKFCERGHENENTLSRNFVRGVTEKRERGHEKKGEGSQNFGTRNTKITKEITTENTSSSCGDDEMMIRECFVAAKGLYAEETISAVAEELRRHDSRYLKMITPPFFLEICKNITEHAAPYIVNQTAYIQKCIENMISGQKLSEANRAHRIRAENQRMNQMYQCTNMEELERRICSN